MGLEHRICTGCVGFYFCLVSIFPKDVDPLISVPEIP